MIIRSLAALLGLLTFGILPLGPLALPAGPSSQPPQSSSLPQDNTPALTLHAESRIVLADITVTDRHGNAVHGLTAKDFQVFDNGRPQDIASFEEHNASSETAAYTATSAPRTASNDYKRLPPVLNVLVIDTTNLELPDQMYLRLQLLKFLNNAPPNQPLAVFERHGDFAVLLQPFTADHALLEAAVNRALPRFILNGRGYRTDTQTLRQIAVYLSQVPGRKNVLWFSGGSTAYLLEGLSALTLAMPATSAMAAASAPAVPITTPSEGEDPDVLRQAYDELEAARIAVYPIDARGLTTEGDVAMGPQQVQMSETAETTGGEAFFNMNGLAQIAAHILSTDSTSYTLTWSPLNFQYNSKWHSIRIVCRNLSYHLSYRRGYFADKPHAPVPATEKHTALFADASGDSTPAIAPDLRSTPLLFEATVHPADSAAANPNFIALRPPAPPAKGTTGFNVDYSLSTSALSSAPVDGSPHATVFFAVIALDHDGRRVGQTFDRIRFPLDPAAPPRRLQVAQQIDLPKGGDFLALVVWDPVSGHMGTLQIPVTVPSPQSR